MILESPSTIIGDRPFWISNLSLCYVPHEGIHNPTRVVPKKSSESNISKVPFGSLVQIEFEMPH